MRRRRRRTYVGHLELERSDLRRRVAHLEAELAAVRAAQVDDAKATVDRFSRLATRAPVHEPRETPPESVPMMSARDAELERRRQKRASFARMHGMSPDELNDRIANGEFTTDSLEVS